MGGLVSQLDGTLTPSAPVKVVRSRDKLCYIAEMADELEALVDGGEETRLLRALLTLAGSEAARLSKF